MKAVLGLLCLLAAGCSGLPLDFGGASEKAWEWRWGWSTYKPSAQPADEVPPFEVPPELLATYSWPDLHAGTMYSLNGGAGRLTPYLGVEVAEFKVPHARWFVIEGISGTDLVGGYVGKRWTSVIEVTTGVGLVYDVEEKTWAPVVGVDLIRF